MNVMNDDANGDTNDDSGHARFARMQKCRCHPGTGGVRRYPFNLLEATHCVAARFMHGYIKLDMV
jgi:hypothetical protein